VPPPAACTRNDARTGCWSLFHHPPPLPSVCVAGIGQVIITHLYVGHFFGETALVNDAPRNAHVRVCKGRVQVMNMSKETFKPFLDGGECGCVRLTSGAAHQWGDWRGMSCGRGCADPKFRKMIGELVMKREEMARRRAKLLEEQGPVITPEQQRNEVKVSKVITKNRTTDGDVIINGYVLTNKLGEGSYGKVYLAKSLANSAKYAVKKVDRSLLRKKRLGGAVATDEDMLREVAVMKRLHHPNIVGLVEVIDDPKGKHFYVRR